MICRHLAEHGTAARTETPPDQQAGLKQATALLSKYKGDQLARVLQAEALLGTGKREQAEEVCTCRFKAAVHPGRLSGLGAQLCEEVADEVPIDQYTHSQLLALCGRLDKPDTADRVTFAARLKAPRNLTFLEAVFTIHVKCAGAAAGIRAHAQQATQPLCRKRDYAAQGDLAMQAAKVVADPDEYRWRAVAARLLQAEHSELGTQVLPVRHLSRHAPPCAEARCVSRCAANADASAAAVAGREPGQARPGPGLAASRGPAAQARGVAEAVHAHHEGMQLLMPPVACSLQAGRLT